jgi:trans-aconitate 2-methyltransferase
MATARDWDARTYHAVANPVEAWGRHVLARLPLVGSETVLDAGCGSGRLTRLLLERLPEGRVFGVDRSPAMLAVAREELAPLGERVRLFQAELTTVSLPEPVDAVFSNATFHWIHDHAALFANLARLLRPGGWLVAQCGGGANCAAISREIDRVAAQIPFRPHLEGMLFPWRFAAPEETADLLDAAGFREIETSLEAAPTPFLDRAAYRIYLGTLILRPYLEWLPAALHDAFVDAVVDEANRTGRGFVADYVRLNMKARRGP